MTIFRTFTAVSPPTSGAALNRLDHSVKRCDGGQLKRREKFKKSPQAILYRDCSVPICISLEHRGFGLGSEQRLHILGQLAGSRRGSSPLPPTPQTASMSPGRGGPPGRPRGAA